MYWIIVWKIFQWPLEWKKHEKNDTATMWSPWDPTENKNKMWPVVISNTRLTIKEIIDKRVTIISIISTGNVMIFLYIFCFHLLLDHMTKNRISNAKNNQRYLYSSPFISAVNCCSFPLKNLLQWEDLEEGCPCQHPSDSSIIRLLIDELFILVRYNDWLLSVSLSILPTVTRIMF